MPDENVAEPVRRVVLLGMMGAGKTTVGRILARVLGWRFVDVDHEIERRAGRSIPRIFAEDGEASFRRIESECTARLAGTEDVVLAPGGGWISVPSNLDALGSGTLSVWLQVDPEEAVRRLKRASVERPLLDSSDPEGAIRRLAAHRDRLYARADITLSTANRSPAEIAGDLAVRIRSLGPGGSSASRK